MAISETKGSGKKSAILQLTKFSSSIPWSTWERNRHPKNRSIRRRPAKLIRVKYNWSPYFLASFSFVPCNRTINGISSDNSFVALMIPLKDKKLYIMSCDFWLVKWDQKAYSAITSHLMLFKIRANIRELMMIVLESQTMKLTFLRKSVIRKTWLRTKIQIKIIQ